MAKKGVAAPLQHEFKMGADFARRRQKHISCDDSSFFGGEGPCSGSLRALICSVTSPGNIPGRCGRRLATNSCARPSSVVVLTLNERENYPEVFDRFPKLTKNDERPQKLEQQHARTVTHTAAHFATPMRAADHRKSPAHLEATASTRTEQGN